MKKTIVAFLSIAITGAILTLSACGGGSDDSSEAATQSVAVTKGNLTTTVSAIGTISMPEQVNLTFGSGGSTTSTNTVSEINVKFGDSVKKGDVLAKIDTASLERAVTQAQANLRTVQINLKQASSEATILRAQASVQSAKISLTSAEEDLKNAEDTTVADAETAVSDAQLALDNAQRSLTAAQKNGEVSLTEAQNSVNAAQKAYNEYVIENIDILTRLEIAAQKDTLAWALQKAQTTLEVTQGTIASSLANAESNATKAQATLNEAEENLAAVQADSVVIQQKQIAVMTAKANLAQAQDDLAYLEAGYDIELLQIKVDNAQVSVDEANDQLEAATIVAPFDGVIAAVNADVGDRVTSTETIITLVNTSVVTVDASVDETDVASVKAGQTAMITFDALTNVMIRGKVTAVGTLAASQSGVVTYALAIELPDVEGLGIRDGMSATIEITSMQAENVLLVLTKAISRSGMNQVV
ncbi:MAG: HlyD family efflux transporter periplasmic adaptor subunit, partial [Dehalococcoidia bacterium]|nr:HlyD family efflux transporter periplasmic adaptor subunit [Dehalococcoidia bacterium]